MAKGNGSSICDVPYMYITIAIHSYTSDIEITACTVVQAVIQATGEGDFRPHSSETPIPIFMKLEIYDYVLEMTQQAKLQVAMSTWVVWANSQFDA